MFCVYVSTFCICFLFLFFYLRILFNLFTKSQPYLSRMSMAKCCFVICFSIPRCPEIIKKKSKYKIQNQTNRLSYFTDNFQFLSTGMCVNRCHLARCFCFRIFLNMNKESKGLGPRIPLSLLLSSCLFSVWVICETFSLMLVNLFRSMPRT